MSVYFSEQKWPEIKKAIEKNSLILLPVGTIEEHGMHLPLNTDEVIARETAKLIGKRLKDEIPLLVMPTIWTGYSVKEMMRWPGTIRIQPETLIRLIYGVCSSLIEMGFKKIVIINGHGNHPGILEIVARKIADTYNAFIAVTNTYTMAQDAFQKVRKSKIGGASHGGEYETSLMLHLTNLVDMKKATNKDTIDYHSDFFPGDGFAPGKKVFWSTWGIHKSKTGLHGDPTLATKKTGKKVMEGTIDTYVRFLREFYRE